MKKTAAFLMALLLTAGCLFMLAGCGKRYTAADLSAYLDKEGFVAGMSQKEFVEKVEKIEGEKVGVLQWDGVQSGGCEINSTYGSYSNGYVAVEDEGEAVYYNTISVTANLKGLKMPAGIRFSDTPSDVLKKLSVEGDPLSEFTPDPETTDVMTLFAGGNVALKLTDHRLTQTETEETDPGTVVCVWDVKYPLVLEFSEVTTRPLDYDRTDTVTRTVRFLFADESSPLGSFCIDVTERYPLMQRYSKEAYAIMNALFASEKLDGYAFKKAVIDPYHDDFHDAEDPEPEMPDEAEIVVDGKRYTGTLQRSMTGAALYEKFKDYPEFSYFRDDGYFRLDAEGKLTRFVLNVSKSFVSQSESTPEDGQRAAERFFSTNITYANLSDYAVTVSEVGRAFGTDLYTVTFVRMIGDVETLDRATIRVLGNGTIYTFDSSMLGRIRLTENPFDLESVGAAIGKKFRAAVGDQESLFDSIDYEIEETVLTLLKDGTPALLVTLTPTLTEIRRDGSGWTYAKTETLIVRLAEE